VFFSTEPGDAWMLEPADQFAARLATDGDPLPVRIEEIETRYAIGWQGRYRIEGQMFIYEDIGSIEGASWVISLGAFRKAKGSQGYWNAIVRSSWAGYRQHRTRPYRGIRNTRAARLTQEAGSPTPLMGTVVQIGALVQVDGVVEVLLIHMDTLSIEQDSIPDGGRSRILEAESAEVELPLRMRCINSMREEVLGLPIPVGFFRRHIPTSYARES
jgi:hypothetical protein